ncbi:flagellar filament capping protein FliD [Geodermatophilus sp. URMC 61]|uniref:flagellar filament capping protein FliD n=1 Tax=Geodermatophilus sp. URMC 61 TaxID=3423411 RepID=UPI00406D2535
MAGMSVDGLISGLDTTSLINQLVQAEGAPKAQLQTRLTTTKAAGDAYRGMNTRFDAVRTAAEALTKPELWSSAKATSSSSSVTTSLSGTPATGTLTVNVTALAATHTVASTDRVALDAPGRFTSIDIKVGTTTTTIPVGGTGTLDDAIKAINASPVKVSASSVQVAPGQYALQLTADESGSAGTFEVTAGGTFTTISKGADAKLTVGTTATALEISSPTNTFTGVMPGLTLTVSKVENGVTVGVAADPQAIAGKVKALVDAVNNALSGIKTYTSATGGPTAVLKGDSGLISLASRVRTQVSDAVGDDGSPWGAGIRLEKDGSVVFDEARFLEKLKADPALVQRLVGGKPATAGEAAVKGVAQRVFDLAKAATDTTTGTLTSLAKGRDDLVKDIQKRIDAWDLRLVQRKQTLTRQFTAMETALSSMKNQSTWLAGQLNSLSS